jgi:hypothetical protein
LNENKLDHEIAVFPNPTSGETTIEISGFVDNEATLEIYDMMGRKWLTEEMTASQHFAESHVNLGGVPSGAYIARIVTKNQVYTKQFIKQ